MAGKWRSEMIGSLVRVASGQVDPKEEQAKSLFVVGPENLYTGGGLDKESLRTAEELGMISGKYAFDEHAILYSKIRPNLNKVCLPDFTGLCSADMYPLWVRDNKSADRIYVYYLLISERFLYEATSRSFRTGLPKINRTDLESIVVEMPPLSEQQHIARILQIWDEAINKASELCTAKDAQYRAIRRSITSAPIKGHSGKDLLKLSEITERVRRVNDGQDHPVMTVSAKSGFILQSDKYSRDMAGTSLENYIVLHRGEFAYNKGNSLTSPQGCIFRLGVEKALVPHVYFCFSLKKGLHEDFFVHLFESGYLNHQLSRVINSGVRNDGLLNLNAADFFNCRVPVPPVEEQARIAGVLNGLKVEIAILDRQIDLYKRQKRGLMQKLLTGEWRVDDQRGAL